MARYRSIRAYLFSIILLTTLVLGGITGYLAGPKALVLKPFGDIFLNLILTAIIPLIFFSVSSAIVRMGSLGALGKSIFNMALVFFMTGVIAALFALVVVKVFPPAIGVNMLLEGSQMIPANNFFNQIANIFTVSEFSKLFSHENLLALIIFSIIVGIAVSQTEEKGRVFASFLQAGEAVFTKFFSLIMYYAPIGFFSYFAVLVSELGPKIMADYARVAVIYYVSATVFFILVYTLYAYFSYRKKGVLIFWKHISLPMFTALATCSSAASIPANLAAANRMGLPSKVYETTIPLGTILHKDGSIIGGMFKIAFLFGMFHLNFSGAQVLLTALGVSMLVGTVMGAIPSGGMLGELLILSIYGFSPSALVVMAAISIIIDPLATMLNVTGNTIASMIIARYEGKNLRAPSEATLFSFSEN